MNSQEILDIIHDPTWVPIRITEGGVLFCKLDRINDFGSRYLYGTPSELRQPYSKVTIPFPALDLIDIPQRTENVHRIYHMSYGGSTILCQLLNIPGKCQTFNEPAYSNRLDLPIMNYKLGQRIIPGEQHVLKTLPATIVDHDTTSIAGDKAVLIVPSLRNFIASVYSDDTQYRHTVVESMAYQLECGSILSLVDACVKVWSAIIKRFNDISTRYDTITIHSDDLLFHPELVLPKVFEFFDIDVPHDQLITQLTLMNTHSKTREPIPDRVEFLLNQRERYMRNCVCDLTDNEDIIVAAEKAATFVNVLRVDP